MSNKTLYFYDSRKEGFDLGKEKAKAKEMRALARDVAAYSERDSLEICDAVAGDVPERYKNVEGIKVLSGKAQQPAEEDHQLDYDQQPKPTTLLVDEEIDQNQQAYRAAENLASKQHAADTKGRKGK